MNRCIELAKNGLGTTYPNPLVGSVVVHNNKIIGEGWHRSSGEPHAEVNAIASVRDKTLLAASTLYVNLEPCSHFGKTPPCSNLIIDSEIKKVVIGNIDSNPKVSGNGVKKLEAAGCKVITGVLEKECDELNRRFFTFHREQRPYIILKWAQTSNGLISPINSRTKKEPVWITNSLSQQRSHKLRAEEQAILIGTTTALDDNPSLTTRDWIGNSPTRFVIDRSLKIKSDASLFSKESKTYFLVGTEGSSLKPYHKRVDFDKPLAQEIAKIVFAEGLQSMIVEGGAKTLQTFIDQNLWDEALVFIGNAKFEDGIPAPHFSGTLISEEKIKSDILRTYKNPHS